MATVTYYVALPFVVIEDGELVAGEAVEKPTANAAIREAIRLSATSVGAVAFSRSGDPATGQFEDAQVIKSYGTVPSLDELLSLD